MIHRTAASWQRKAKKDGSFLASDRQTFVQLPTTHWQQQLQSLITDPLELLERLEIDPDTLGEHYRDQASQAGALFPVKVPLSFIGRMKKGDSEDPLLRQVLPVGQELASITGYSSDPVGEQQDQATGLIHKYHGRVLLLVNGHCAINCRYCFRREFPYADNRLNRSQREAVLADIAKDTSISEVIYSGGDPLASSDKQLGWLSAQIAQIPHIKRLRIHTRLPVVIPDRITSETLEWMVQENLSTVVVLHINHPNELKDAQLHRAIASIRQAGITLLNQSVLLKGVNDSCEVLCELSESLFSLGILPYYLHLLDKVNGSAHFDVDENQAKQLHQAITHRLPGYLVPKLVREIANEASKTWI